MFDKNNHIPLKMQLEEIIRSNIETGVWKINQQIPSENELARQYDISRMTARNVVVKLALEGLLYTVQGKGTFVSEPKIISKPLREMGICSQLEVQGLQTVTRMLGSDVVSASSFMAKKLGVNASTLLWEIKRVRFVKGETLSLHISYIPVTICPGLDKKDLVGRQLCHVIEEDYGLTIVTINETIEIKSADEFAAEALLIPLGEPLLLIGEHVFTSGNSPIEFTWVYFRGTKIKLQLSK